MSSDAPPSALPTLPRGRHKLPPEAVRASQEERLLQAMLALVGEHGYAGTSVPQVVARARVSRNAFYELFADKTDCFLALCDRMADELLHEIAQPRADDWRGALRAGLRHYLHWWQERPAFSRTYFVELPSAGVRAVEQRERQYARFRNMFVALGEWARQQDPDLLPPHPLASRAIVYAVTEIIADEVRSGRAAELGELEDDLVTLIDGLLARKSH